MDKSNQNIRIQPAPDQGRFENFLNSRAAELRVANDVMNSIHQNASFGALVDLAADAISVFEARAAFTRVMSLVNDAVHAVLVLYFLNVVARAALMLKGLPAEDALEILGGSVVVALQFVTEVLIYRQISRLIIQLVVFVGDAYLTYRFTILKFRIGARIFQWFAMWKNKNVVVQSMQLFTNLHLLTYPILCVGVLFNSGFLWAFLKYKHLVTTIQACMNLRKVSLPEIVATKWRHSVAASFRRFPLLKRWFGPRLDFSPPYGDDDGTLDPAAIPDPKAEHQSWMNRLKEWQNQSRSARKDSLAQGISVPVPTQQQSVLVFAGGCFTFLVLLRLFRRRIMSYFFVASDARPLHVAEPVEQEELGEDSPALRAVVQPVPKQSDLVDEDGNFGGDKKNKRKRGPKNRDTVGGNSLPSAKDLHQGAVVDGKTKSAAKPKKGRDAAKDRSANSKLAPKVAPSPPQKNPTSQGPMLVVTSTEDEKKDDVSVEQQSVIPALKPISTDIVKSSFPVYALISVDGDTRFYQFLAYGFRYADHFVIGNHYLRGLDPSVLVAFGNVQKEKEYSTVSVETLLKCHLNRDSLCIPLKLLPALQAIPSIKSRCVKSSQVTSAETCFMVNAKNMRSGLCPALVSMSALKASGLHIEDAGYEKVWEAIIHTEPGDCGSYYVLSTASGFAVAGIHGWGDNQYSYAYPLDHLLADPVLNPEHPNS